MTIETYCIHKTLGFRFLLRKYYVEFFVIDCYACVAVVSARQTPPTSKACLDCDIGIRALLPPEGTANQVCYQGANNDANECCNKDPVLSPDADSKCGYCSDFGYTTYETNDPMYKKWVYGVLRILRMLPLRL